MVKNNKQIIKQVIIILLLVLPLIIIISVSADVLNQYSRIIKSSFKIEKRPSEARTKENIEADFECTEVNERSDQLIEWELTGKNILNEVNNTFTIVTNFPQLKNNGILTKFYKIKLNDNVRAKKDLYVALKKINSYFIHKNDNNKFIEEPKQYFQLANEQDSIKFYLQDSKGDFNLITAQMNDNENNTVLGKTELIKGPQENSNNITEKQFKDDLSMFENFQKQYPISNILGLEIKFKINQAQMEKDGLWDTNSNYLTKDGHIILSTAIELFTTTTK